MTRSRWLPGVGRNDFDCVKYSASFGGVPTPASQWALSPSIRNKLPNLASQIDTAFSSIERNTGSSYHGELEITFNTSEVVFCCCCDSVMLRVLACIC